MSEWWTYGLQDFLMFAPATYQRLFALHNAALWPAQLVVLPLGLLVLGWLAWRPARWRMACVLVAAGWAATAWSFHWQHYTSIHTAAPWFAALCGLQALVLGWIARHGSPWLPHQASAWRYRGGCLLLATGVLAWPWFGPLLGRSWQQAALFGLAPDATALGTLGLLLCLRRRPARDMRWHRHLAAALPWAWPLAWCFASAATLWTLRMPEAWPLAALALLAALGATQSPRQVPPT